MEKGSSCFPVDTTGFCLHSAIYAARPDVRCIIHLHTPATAAVSASPHLPFFLSVFELCHTQRVVPHGMQGIALGLAMCKVSSFPALLWLQSLPALLNKLSEDFQGLRQRKGKEHPNPGDFSLLFPNSEMVGLGGRMIEKRLYYISPSTSSTLYIDWH